MPRKKQVIRNVLAIDFETAASGHDTICAMGLCTFDFATGDLICKEHYLIDPACDFSVRNTSIHGITADMVIGSPTFLDALPLLAHRISDDTLVVAHSAASADISFLTKTCARFGVQPPDCQYMCTYVLSRLVLPNLPDHKLPTIAAHYGLGDFQHHRADDDAEICGRSFFALLGDHSDLSFSELGKLLGVRVGRIKDGAVTSCKARPQY